MSWAPNGVGNIEHYRKGDKDIYSSITPLKAPCRKQGRSSFMQLMNNPPVKSQTFL
jgi:hypothetical protein